MNYDENQTLVRYRFTKAKDTFKEAELVIENKMWNAAVNRLYYACYYAVSALLINNNIQSKTHSGTRQMFGLHFIESGKIKNSTGKFYSKLFSKRQGGDYEDWIDYEETDVLVLLQPALDLIAEIEQVLFPTTLP